MQISRNRSTPVEFESGVEPPASSGGSLTSTIGLPASVLPPPGAMGWSSLEQLAARNASATNPKSDE
jgi:hypothetical protein